MSLYTTKYLDILRNYALPETNQSFDDLINSNYDKFFNFDFPWYAPDDAGKEDFEKLFLLHYLMYEIGQETIELHRAMLASRLREIMPYYSSIYESLNIDMPWHGNIDVEYTEENAGNKQGTTDLNVDASINGSSSDESSSDTNQQTQSIDSDNPQINFSGTDYASQMNRGESTQNRRINSSGTTSNTEERTEKTNTNEDTTSKSNRTEKGYRGITRGQIVKEMRKSIYNINMEIIDRCKDLFMLVY